MALNIKRLLRRTTSDERNKNLIKNNIGLQGVFYILMQNQQG